MNRELELKRQKKIHGLEQTISKTEMTMLNKGYPIQKIIGFINFDDLEISIKQNVLIPRYETEEVVEEALKYIDDSSQVLDLCCGSGYIGLTISQKTNALVTLSDIEWDAIRQTTENAKNNNLNVKIIQSDLFSNIIGKFNVIVCNPPYIPNGMKLDSKVINYEPHNALFGGEDGNKFYRKILQDAPKYLNKNGYLIFEISNDNANYLSLNHFKIINDINGKKRIAIKKY